MSDSLHTAFGQLLIFADVDEQPLLLDDFVDGQFLVRLGFDFVARTETHAFQWCLVGRVNTGFACNLELDLDATAIGRHDDAQPEFRLRLANPPLTWNEHTHEMAAGYMRVLPRKCNFRSRSFIYVNRGGWLAGLATR